MSLGIATLNTNQKRDPSGPPFVPASAKNGVSVAIDGSGAIVLGQNIGQAGNPAVLLSNREIPLAGFRIDFTDPVNSTIVRINNSPLNPFFLQANVNAQWSNIIAQNASNGNQATSFLGSYNDLGNNISLVKTSSTYTGNFGYPFNTGIVYSASVGGLGTDAMAFVTEAGFYWAPNTTGAGGTAQVAMRMLTSGRVQIYPIGTFATATDNGAILQINGQAVISSFNTLGVRTPNTSQLAVVGSDTLAGTIAAQRTSNSVNGAIIGFYKSRGTDPTTPAAVAANDQLGRLLWQGADSGNVVRTAIEIRGLTPGPGATFVQGNLAIGTVGAAGALVFRYWFSPEGGIGINTATYPAAGNALEILTGQAIFQGTTGNTIRFQNAAAAPATTAGPVFANYYGGNTNALGDPAGWFLVNNNGTDVKIPFYNV